MGSQRLRCFNKGVECGLFNFRFGCQSRSGQIEPVLSNLKRAVFQGDKGGKFHRIPLIGKLYGSVEKISLTLH